MSLPRSFTCHGENSSLRAKDLFGRQVCSVPTAGGPNLHASPRATSVLTVTKCSSRSSPHFTSGPTPRHHPIAPIFEEVGPAWHVISLTLLSNPTFPGYRSCWSRLPSLGGSVATKFDRSRLVDSQNGKMLGPAGPKLAALCSSRRTSAVAGCRI